MCQETYTQYAMCGTVKCEPVYCEHATMDPETREWRCRAATTETQETPEPEMQNTQCDDPHCRTCASRPIMEPLAQARGPADHSQAEAMARRSLASGRTPGSLELSDRIDSNLVRMGRGTIRSCFPPERGPTLAPMRNQFPTRAYVAYPPTESGNADGDEQQQTRTIAGQEDPPTPHQTEDLPPLSLIELQQQEEPAAETSDQTVDKRIQYLELLRVEGKLEDWQQRWARAA